VDEITITGRRPDGSLGAYPSFNPSRSGDVPSEFLDATFDLLLQQCAEDPTLDFCPGIQQQAAINRQQAFVGPVPLPEVIVRAPKVPPLPVIAPGPFGLAIGVVTGLGILWSLGEQAAQEAWRRRFEQMEPTPEPLPEVVVRAPPPKQRPAEPAPMVPGIIEEIPFFQPDITIVAPRPPTPEPLPELAPPRPPTRIPDLPPTIEPPRPFIEPPRPKIEPVAPPKPIMIPPIPIPWPDLPDRLPETEPKPERFPDPTRPVRVDPVEPAPPRAPDRPAPIRPPSPPPPVPPLPGLDVSPLIPLLLTPFLKPSLTPIQNPAVPLLQPDFMVQPPTGPKNCPPCTKTEDVEQKKPRTVCYGGYYQERANGAYRYQKWRKIKCR